MPSRPAPSEQTQTPQLSQFESVDASSQRASRTKTTSEVIEDLKTQLALFDDNSKPLASKQLESYKSAHRLFEKPRKSLSRSRVSERTRARKLLTDVFVKLGTEIFFLCAITIRIDTLCRLPAEDFLAQLESWWNTSRRPRGLTTQAGSMCSSAAVEMVSERQKEFDELGVSGTFSGCIPILFQALIFLWRRLSTMYVQH